MASAAGLLEAPQSRGELLTGMPMKDLSCCAAIVKYG
jgi:hypothetical protein